MCVCVCVGVFVKLCCVLNKCSERMVRIRYVPKLQHQSYIQSSKCIYKVTLKLKEFHSMDTHTVSLVYNVLWCHSKCSLTVHVPRTPNAQQRKHNTLPSNSFTDTAVSAIPENLVNYSRLGKCSFSIMPFCT